MNEIERGDRAGEILANPAWQEAFEAIEKELIETWKRESNADVREKLWLKHGLLTKVRTQLESFLLSGRIARERSLLTKAKDLVRSGLR